ncbi:MAG: hypothetical protein WB767_10790 [Nocardioides sp.]
MSTTGTNLELIRRPRVALLGGVVVLTGALILLLVRTAHPGELPVSDRTVNASTPISQPVYVGVFSAGAEFARTLDLSGVKVHTTSNTEVSVTPLLCKAGTVGVTTDPDAFCAELVNPEGQAFTSGDSIVLQVTSDEAAIAVIDRVRLGFREGFQWGTLPAGQSAIVRVLAR